MASRICCLDLDAFFVSVERLDRPELAGQPVVVGARPGSRGVVTAASYEVREFGVRSGMPIREAYRRAPQAIYLPTRHGQYGKYSAQVKAVLQRFCPAVQMASIDEFFLDFRDCEAMYRTPDDADDDAAIERAVHAMRAAIQQELGLPASAGLATSRPVAKIASGSAKPAGVVMVRGGDEIEFLRKLPVRRWPGIGPVAEQRLHRIGVKTLGQLIDTPGRLGDAVRACTDGAGGRQLGRDRPAFREHDIHGLTHGSVSSENTFSADVGDWPKLEAQLAALCERVCWRIRRRGVLARTATLKLRYSNFETITRSRTIKATDAEQTVFDCVRQHLVANYDRRRPVRLLGVCLSNLTQAEKQMTLPFDDEARPEAATAVDAVRERFGYDAIHLGVNRHAAPPRSIGRGNA